MKRLTVPALIMMITACVTTPTENKNDNAEVNPPAKVVNQNPIIGGVERLYVEDIKVPFHARVDTGAEISSIDAMNVTPFERDGEKWVAFEIVNRSDGKKKKKKKPLKRKTTIKRTLKQEQRYVVKLKVRMGKNLVTAEFSLNDRSKFDYQVLIGRNIINGRYLVDTSISNTLR